MVDIVMGTERYLSELQATDRYLSENIGASLPVSSEDRRQWREARDGVEESLDSIEEVRFEAVGRFLPELPEEGYPFQYGSLPRRRLEVTFSRQCNEESDRGSDGPAQLWCDIKGIISMIPPHSKEQLGKHLPWLILKGKDLPVDDIMKEVCLREGGL